MKKVFTVVLAFASLLSSTSVLAQEDETSKSSKVEVNAGADLVSAYLWRGQHLGSAAFQPSLGFTAGGFSLGAWGSAEFDGGNNELDFSAAYSFSKIGLTLGLTDYYGLYYGQDKTTGVIWDSDHKIKYNNYDNHILELNAGLDFASFCDKFAMTISANVNLANDDDHSTYIEFGYPVKAGSVDVDFALGLTPAEGSYSTGFNVVNLSIKGTKSLEFSPKFSLPVFAQVVYNPNKEQCALAFGMSF